MNGSFYHRIPWEQGQYCMETTSTSALALNIAKEQYQKNIDIVNSFMCQMQLPDGSWDIGIPGIRKNRRSPSIAGFVCSALLCQNIHTENVQKGIEFIMSSQYEDGQWGDMAYNTYYYYTYPILLALKLFHEENSVTYKRAVDFIHKTQNPNGSFGVEIAGRPSVELRTSLALNSLLVSPRKEDLESIDKGISWLKKHQQSDGHWGGGYYNIERKPDKKEDIYATDMAIFALARYLRFKSGHPLLCPGSSN
jgi:squalene cyclase